ncbi:hypothetical protein B0H11DRAFT_2273188 [Mycena galericulata]|nr:hypothetical protein B0H11DRAFT_2273188 [Mycena galericulata]
MHRDLRLDNLARLPPAVRRVASAACSARRSLQDVARFMVAAADASEDEDILLLPAYYVLLDPTGIPTMEQLDSPVPALETSITQVLDLLQFLFRIPVPLHLGSDLWPRVWKWVYFLHTYRDHLPGPPIDEATFCLDFILFAANFHTDEAAAEFICATPRFIFLAARAWTFIFHDHTKDWRELVFAQLWCFVADMDPSNPKNFEDIVEGAGGMHNLARILIGSMEHILATRESPVAGRTVYFLRIILDFLMDTEGKDTDGGLSPFYVALAENDIGGVLSSAACALVQSAEDASEYALNKCFLILAQIFISERGHNWIPSALSRGLLRALVSCPQFTDQISRQLNFFFLMLPSSLIYYRVVSEMGGALEAAQDLASAKAFKDSEVHAKWEGFVELAQERLNLLKMFDSEDFTPLKACDNLECGNIRPKTDFKRCSGCLSFYYCSDICQAADWQEGGHRTSCAAYSSNLCLNARQRLTVREREFIRAVVHDDYCGNKPHIYVEQFGMLRRSPDSLPFTMFDYSSGPLHVTVQPAESATRDLSTMRGAGDEWADSVARAKRSGRRMALHIVTIRTGRTVRSLLVPLRKNHSRADEILEEMAKSKPVFSPEFATKFRYKFEEVERDVVETH